MTKQSALTRRVKSYIQAHQMIQTESHILVALSGGADSVCLLRVLRELQAEWGISLSALHVHHGIRGTEADADAQFCQKLCEQWGVPCYVTQVDVPAVADAQKMSLEEAARLVRYQELEAYRKRLGAACVAVAHHREDQAETVLWNLFRGSGLKGLGGMEPVNGTVIRPLLEVSKGEILTYLQNQALTWQQDGSNDGDDYTRNRIRHHILDYAARKVNPRAAAHICQAAQVASQADGYLRRLAQSWLEGHGRKEGDTMILEVGSLRQEEEILQSYILREALRQCGDGAAELTDITARHMEALQALVTDVPGGSAARQVDLSAEVVARRCYDRLLLERKNNGDDTALSSVAMEEVSVDLDLLWQRFVQDDDKPISVCFGGDRYELRIFSCKKTQKIPTNQYTKWINYDKLERTLVFRARRTGDYILLPDGGRKTVKSYMIDEKIPARERDRIPVIAQGSHVLWIAGYRLSEGAKITGDTRYILEIQKYGG